MSRFSSRLIAERESPASRREWISANRSWVRMTSRRSGTDAASGTDTGAASGSGSPGSCGVARRHPWWAATVLPAASHRFFHRWNRSATWIASGAAGTTAWA